MTTVSLPESTLDALPQPPRSLDGSFVSARMNIRELIEAYGDFVWRVLRRVGVPERLLDDVIQEVFLTVAGKLDQIPRGYEKSFLFGTAVNIASNAKRGIARKQETSFGDEIEWAHPQLTVDELIDQRRARALLDQVLDAMPLELRTVFVLHELEDVTVPEIAGLVGIPVGTASSRLRRARDEFRRLVTRIAEKK